ncbi:hypothetical protein AAF712_010171 [Marasmius tenuissimus]|uniref:Uncharacterized protein n=1 Tax=Marasmius tenuissimus TaxID=585030 RepID=A0ABR2ZNR4_9AGAR
MPKVISSVSPSKATPYSKCAPGRPTLLSQRAVNEDCLEKVLLDLRDQARLVYPERPANMPGDYLKSVLFRATGKVYGPQHPEFYDLGRICFIPRDQDERWERQEKVFEPDKANRSQDLQDLPSKQHHPNNIIPQEMLHRSQDLLDCLALRDTLRPLPRKNKTNVLSVESEVNKTTGRAFSTAASSQDTYPTHRPILDLPPLKNDSDNDYPLDGFELLPYPSSDDLPLPVSDATICGSEDTYIGNFSNGKHVEDLPDAATD